MLIVINLSENRFCVFIGGSSIFNASTCFFDNSLNVAPTPKFWSIFLLSLSQK